MKNPDFRNNHMVSEDCEKSGFLILLFLLTVISFMQLI